MSICRKCSRVQELNKPASAEFSQIFKRAIKNARTIGRHIFSLSGWLKRLELSTARTTTECSNQLSYSHHMFLCSQQESNLRLELRKLIFYPLNYESFFRLSRQEAD